MPPSRNNGFRINNRYLLLTYAQVGTQFDWGELHTLLLDLGAKSVCGREAHQDGGVHLHCFVDFKRAYSTRDQRKFDVMGAHPNVQPISRTPWMSYDYAKKDGDILWEDDAVEPVRRASGTSNSDDWAAIANASTREEFFELAASLAPRQLCCAFTNLRAYADWKFVEPEREYSSPAGMETFTGAFPEAERWLVESLQSISTGRR